MNKWSKKGLGVQPSMGEILVAQGFDVSSVERQTT